MEVVDIARNVLSWMDNTTIEKIYLLGLVPELASISQSQHFWYSRVLRLGVSFPFSSDIDWKQTYQLAARGLDSKREARLWNEHDNDLATLILYMKGDIYLSKTI